MSLTILFAAPEATRTEYAPHLPKALQEAGVDARIVAEADPATVDYIVYTPASPLQDFTPFTKAKAVLSLWAGVERIVGNATLTQPLCRMVDPALAEGMMEWVTGHVLRHHLGMDRQIRANGPDWVQVTPPLARERRVTVLGLGELGLACAKMLAALNFDVTGWSRSPKQVNGLRCLHGDAGLRQALDGAEIVVTILPDTPATTNLLDAERLSWMAKGAVVINPGRGPLIDDSALLAALDAGQIGHATLDVFRIEPLPNHHPFWAHPSVTVTPHVAAATRASSASRVVAENVRRSEAGEALLHLVDRAQGY